METLIVSVLFGIIAFMIRTYYVHLLKVKENECNSLSSRFVEYEKETRKVIFDIWQSINDLSFDDKQYKDKKEAINDIYDIYSKICNIYIRNIIILPNNIQKYFSTFFTNFGIVLPLMADIKDIDDMKNDFTQYIETERTKLANLIRKEYGLHPIKLVYDCPKCAQSLYEDITNNEISCFGCNFKEELDIYEQNHFYTTEYKIKKEDDEERC